jgi:acetyl esterase/lipase
MELAEKRRSFEQGNAHLPLAGGVTVAVEHRNGVPIHTFSPESASGTILYFHGGGFRMGSPRASASYLSNLAAATSMTVEAVEYRLAPEHPFPAAVNDGIAAYEYLLARSRADHRVVVAGDSAGGGLAASLLLAVREQGLREPSAVVLLSPWLDLRLESASIDTNAATDRLFSRAIAQDGVLMYLGGRVASDPLASPGLGDWRGSPPLLIQTSAAEILRDDAVQLAQKASADGVRVWFQEYSGEQHVWHYGYPATPGSRAAVGQIAAFLALIE